MSLDRIPEARLRQRLADVRQVMATRDLTALLIYAGPRRLGGGGPAHYLLGWTPLNGHAALVIPILGRPVVLSNGPHDTRIYIDRVVSFADVRRVDGGARPLADAICRALDETAAGNAPRFGISGRDDMPALLQEEVAASRSFVACDAPLAALRLHRDDDAVAMHRRAAEISDAMIARAMQYAATPDGSPPLLMAEVEATGRRLGADLSSLWLATGQRPPTTYFELFELAPSLGANDRIQLGTTLSYEGHFGQSLRMGVRDKPSTTLRDCARMLVDIQDAALAEMVPGRPLHRLSDMLEGLIDRHCPYQRNSDPFRFQACHALGVNYAEPAYATALSPDRDRSQDREGPLVTENMVIEIHPNFTLPDLGHVCAGDMALVTANGAEWMTRYPRGLVELD